MAGKIPLAFLFGLISVVTPCVLPLVPGYLSAVSAVEASRLGERGVARRVAAASLPFSLGFTIVFVALGAAASAISGVLSSRAQGMLVGFVLVVFGLTFMGLLKLPDRLVAPSLLTGARRYGTFFLGAAFGACAAPCISGFLAIALSLAARGQSVVEGSILLLAYSAGLAFAFMLAAIAFTRAMGAFRWIRDRYLYIQIAGGTLLVGLGLLFFFNRDWWLRAAFNHVLDALGLGNI